MLLPDAAQLAAWEYYDKVEVPTFCASGGKPFSSSTSQHIPIQGSAKPGGLAVSVGSEAWCSCPF